MRSQRRPAGVRGAPRWERLNRLQEHTQPPAQPQTILPTKLQKYRDFRATPGGLSSFPQRLCSYLPRTMSIPDISNSNFARGNLPTQTVSRLLSTAIIWETLATEFFGSPVKRAARWTFPGAKAHLRLLVRGTQTTVAIRLRFKASHWTITTGLRKPGPDPFGESRSAHQISPCEITTRFAPECDGWPKKERDLPIRRFQRRPCSLRRLLLPVSGAPSIPVARR